MMLPRERRSAGGMADLREGDLVEHVDPPSDSLVLPQQQAVEVHDGQRLVGHVAIVGGFVRAWKANGIPLGLFGTKAEAQAAVLAVGRAIG